MAADTPTPPSPDPSERNTDGTQGQQAPPQEGAADNDEKDTNAKDSTLAQKALARLDATSPVLFHTPDGAPYIKPNSLAWVLPLESDLFKTWFAGWYWSVFKSPLGDSTYNEIVAVLSAKARYEGPEHEVHLRIAHLDNRIYLDLGDKEGHIVHIDETGWRLAKDVPVFFWRPNGIQALPLPIKGGSLSLLRNHLNARSLDVWVLVCAFLIGQFNPRGTMPILAIQGTQGSGKSTMSKILKEILDPSSNKTRSLPRRAEEIFIAAVHNFLVIFDNISSGVKPAYSDILCTLTTGGGIATRKYYTNFEETYINAKRSVILNGIDDLAIRGDLAQRTLTVNLGPIEFQSEDLYDAFRSDHPKILGALLTAASVALRNLAKEKADHTWKRPRLSDFALFVAAATHGNALPFKRPTFLKVLKESQERQRDSIMGESPLVIAFSKLAVTMEEGEKLQPSAGDLLAMLENVSDLNRFSYGFPRNPRALSQFIKRDLETICRLAHLEIKLGGGREKKTRRKTILIRKQVTAKQVTAK